ncbi:MAG TPA: 50S ribosomal protein L29 [Anaerolineales bacterium]|nr:50S ribosomal protein L29 [Anaerolineales bacterium]
MKISEIRTLQSGEIEGKLDNAREELFKLRFQITTGQMSDTSRLTMVKRDIARCLTVLRERQLAAELSAKAEK